MLAESVLLGAIAALMSVPTGVLMAWVLTDAIQLRAFGWTMPFVIEATPLWFTLLLGLVREGMESALELKIPLVVDMHAGGNWAEAHG